MMAVSPGGHYYTMAALDLSKNRCAKNKTARAYKRFARRKLIDKGCGADETGAARAAHGNGEALRLADGAVFMYNTPANNIRRTP